MKKLIFRSIEPALIALYLLGVSGAANLILGFNLISFGAALFLAVSVLAIWIVSGSETCMNQPAINKMVVECAEKTKSALTWKWTNTLDVVVTILYCYFGWWFTFFLSAGVIALTKVPAYLLVESLKTNETIIDSSDTIA